MTAARKSPSRTNWIHGRPGRQTAATCTSARAPKSWAASEKIPPANYEKIKYDLMRMGFDVETGAWGEAETVLSSKDTGLSITLPRFSPDGRFLVFCMSDYSTFPTFQPSSDLYLMDLKTGRYGRMECNSDQAESWHCWSSNSRWLVFSSKRGPAC